MQGILIKKIILTIAILIVQATVFIAQNNATFFTKDGKLFDSNGNEFIIRGINNPHIWFPEASYKALDTISKFGTNAVRIVWQKKGAASELRKIINRVIELKMIAIPEIHDATGKNKIGELEAAAKYWIREDIKAVLEEFKPYIILNMANEWMASSDPENWYNGYKTSIDIIRNAGLTHCLLIDAAGWGQNLDPTKKHALDLLNNDPQKNLIFAVHIYGTWNDNSKIENELNYFSQKKIPLLVGEFGYNSSNGNNNLKCKVDVAFLLQKCNELGIGYIPWSWTGNDHKNQWLDMVSINDWTTLTEWGKLVMFGKNGIINTSKRCSIFKNK